MTVLRQLLENAQRRAATMVVPAGATTTTTRPSFAQALRGKQRLAVIAEFKRQSPSRGGIAPLADVLAHTQAYARAGAAAVSVLTEPSRFGGDIDDLRLAATTLAQPVLMKDFVVASVQVELAAALGAAAVLLIVRCLARDQLMDLAQACTAHGLTPLVECHNEAEIELALRIDGAVIGVNNRDLDTLALDLDRAPRLLRRVPADRICVAESGYQEPADVDAVRGLADAVLIGTALMQRADASAFIAEVTR